MPSGSDMLIMICSGASTAAHASAPATQLSLEIAQSARPPIVKQPVDALKVQLPIFPDPTGSQKVPAAVQELLQTQVKLAVSQRWSLWHAGKQVSMGPLVTVPGRHPASSATSNPA